MKEFQQINKAYNNVFKAGKLSIGLVVPIENYAHHSVPTMQHHLERVQLIEQLGFKALWVRDVPFQVPSFGDAGQTFDPFTYLGFLAGQTSDIALGIASIALPLHQPVHVAKSAATIDLLSNGRLIMGVASGDRYDEYPAMGIDYESRGERFREAFEIIRKAQEDFPKVETKHFGTLKGHIDILPKTNAPKIPMMMTGFSRQSMEWNAEHADGWMNYPRNPQQQEQTIMQWRSLVAEYSTFDKPFMQPLYVDLHKDDDFQPQPIHLGFRVGVNYLIEYFKYLESIGVNHIAVNLRFNSGIMESTLERFADRILPHFETAKQTVTA